MPKSDNRNGNQFAVAHSADNATKQAEPKKNDLPIVPQNQIIILWHSVREVALLFWQCGYRPLRHNAAEQFGNVHGADFANPIVWATPKMVIPPYRRTKAA